MIPPDYTPDNSRMKNRTMRVRTNFERMLREVTVDRLSALGIGIVATLAMAVSLYQFAVPKYSPRATVTGQVESVYQEHSGLHVDNHMATVTLVPQHGNTLILSYDPTRETFNVRQLIHVTYTVWDSRTRVVHPVSRPDTEVLTVNRDEDTAPSKLRVVLAMVVAIACFAYAGFTRDSES
jgi:hypothetical protein